MWDLAFLVVCPAIALVISLVFVLALALGRLHSDDMLNIIVLALDHLPSADMFDLIVLISCCRHRQPCRY